MWPKASVCKFPIPIVSSRAYTSCLLRVCWWSLPIGKAWRPDLAGLGHQQTRFWEHLWLGNKTLKDESPELYRITRRKNVTVANVFNSRSLNVSFRRALLGNKLTPWLQLVSKVTDVALNNEKDVFVWSPNKNGLFTVKSMYSNMMTNEAYPAFCRS